MLSIQHGGADKQSITWVRIENQSRKERERMDRLITIPEVAEITGFSQGFVAKLFTAGLIPCLKNGRVRKCRRMAVDEFMKNYEGYDITDPFNVKPIESEG